jgi:hypothetical protein
MAENVECNNMKNELNNDTKDENENLIVQKVHSAKTNDEIIFEVLLPNMPRSLPTLDVEFVPTEPSRRFFTANLNSRLLTRRIYIEMLRAIRMYGELERIAPNEDKESITNLKNQMEILSLAMLNIYGRITDRNKVPFFSGGGTKLSRDYQRALQQMYDKVWHIHNLTQRLINQTSDAQIRSTLLIIYTNLKSQLQTIENLKNN